MLNEIGRMARNHRDRPAINRSLRIADRMTAGSTVYAEGRFYRCVDRVGLGGNGMEDVVLLKRVRVDDCGITPDDLLVSSVTELDGIEREGRAAMVTPDDPRADPLGIPHLPPAPIDLGTATRLAMA